jgi:hypothetical protein
VAAYGHQIAVNGSLMDVSSNECMVVAPKRILLYTGKIVPKWVQNGPFEILFEIE